MHNRRSFLKVSALAGGGMLLNFGWVAASKTPVPPGGMATTNELTAYIKITPDNKIILMSPNPEGGQNVKTSMPMIVAEELDVDWQMVEVEQAHLDTEHFTRQFIGGSQALRLGWKSLRTAGATARQMLREAAALQWKVPVEEISTDAGTLYHKKSGKSARYGDMASSASRLAVPTQVPLKQSKDFKIIGTSPKNVDGKKIVTGQPLFGIDIQREGMLIAMIVHPPAFGMKLKSVESAAAKQMRGIKDVFTFKSLRDDFTRSFFDTVSFTDLVAVVGTSTWEVMQAKKALKVEWEPLGVLEGNQKASGKPAGLESTADHAATMEAMAKKEGTVRRKDGDFQNAWKTAAKTLERSYTGPFLAHNCMEPMNFFAHVTDEKAELIGPLQKPEITEKAVAARLGMPLEKIDIQMTRLGGGFGRRSFAHFLVEAAVISQKVKAPVKLVYSREDDMTSGIYRPTYRADYRAALDADNNLIGFQVKAGGIPESPLSASRFPASAVENYQAEDWSLDSHITFGSFRAPRSNFMASAEQSFLDEVAELAGKDPITFRLELLKRAAENPVGKNDDYDPKRYADVLSLVREKSNWDQRKTKSNLGVSAYFCHNTYVATVLELEIKDSTPRVKKAWTAIDCGIVVNPNSARNMAEGCIVDGIGTAFFGNMSFTKGVPGSKNFDTYRMIRMKEAPLEIEVHFVENTIDPTGMGEPAYPPVFAALANAMYQATGKRLYKQPFMEQIM